MYIKNLMLGYVRGYQSPKVISVPPAFNAHPDEKAITIIRKGYGLVGLKDNWIREEIQMGRIPFLLGRYLRYESKMLRDNPSLAILPANRIVRINKILKVLPRFLSKRITKLTENHKWV